MKMNTKQIELLETVFRFRFVSVLVLEKLWPNMNRSVIRSRLEVLRKNGYVGKFHEPEYRLAGKPAVYYLLPAGIDTLRKHAEHDEQTLHAMYKNRSVSAGFIDHALAAAELCVHLTQTYSGMEYYTPTDLNAFEHMPKRTVDGLFRLDNRWFVLVYIEVSANAVYKQQLSKLIGYHEGMEWEVNMSVEFPAVLIVCENQKLESTVRRHVRKVLFASNAGLDIYTAQRDRLLSLTDSEEAIWSPAGGEEEPAVLGSL